MTHRGLFQPLPFCDSVITAPAPKYVTIGTDTQGTFTFEKSF